MILMKKDIFINEEIPIINGILYPDGFYEKIRIFTNQNKKEVIKYNKKIFNLKCDIDTSYPFVNDELKINLSDTVICGEGSYGGDGFIMAFKSSTQEIQWLASFDNSNPFIKLEIFNYFIIATNNLNEKWRFDISDLNDIKIEIL